MDRLPALTFVLLVLAACDGPAADSGVQPEGRVNAVLANSKKASLADVCDVAPSAAQPFSWPELTAEAPGKSGARYRWVNVWATWCKPCVEELPLLAASFGDWKKHGQAVTLTLLSVDSDAGAAKTFVAERPALPGGLQLKEGANASTWLASVGLASGSAIPVHLVLDAEDKLLCARSGGISPEDLERFHRALFPQ
jgi:thiol-disulfide isomerase/thioredoxin